jgi:hypothetical protein
MRPRTPSYVWMWVVIDILAFTINIRTLLLSDDKLIIFTSCFQTLIIIVASFAVYAAFRDGYERGKG